MSEETEIPWVKGPKGRLSRRMLAWFGVCRRHALPREGSAPALEGHYETRVVDGSLEVRFRCTETWMAEIWAPGEKAPVFMEAIPLVHNSTLIKMTDGEVADFFEFHVYGKE